MKVLGNTSGKGYIVEMSQTEMMNLVGARYESSDEWKAANVQIGSQVQIHEIYENLLNFKTVINFNDKMIKEFQAQCDRLTKIKIPRVLQPNDN